MDRHEVCLARLRAALPGGAVVVEALVASREAIGEASVEPYACLLANAEKFRFEVAAPGTWQRPESQMKWAFSADSPAQITVTLPPFYAAASVPPDWNRGYLDRLRQITVLAKPGPGRRLPVGHSVAGYGFITIDRPPLPAIAAIADGWPMLRFALRHRPLTWERGWMV